MKSPQRSDIEMIVMRVAEEYRIDRRQVIEVDAGLGYPFRSHEREGTCSLRPNRIRGYSHPLPESTWMRVPPLLYASPKHAHLALLVSLEQTLANEQQRS